jgi:hypothetical protein
VQVESGWAPSQDVMAGVLRNNPRNQHHRCGEHPRRDRHRHEPETETENETEMIVFETPAHPASLAGVCPGPHKSAGKPRHVRTRPGNTAQRCARDRGDGRNPNHGSFLQRRYRRLAGRRGPIPAVLAIEHRSLSRLAHSHPRPALPGAHRSLTTRPPNHQTHDGLRHRSPSATTGHPIFASVNTNP